MISVKENQQKTSKQLNNNKKTKKKKNKTKKQTNPTTVRRGHSLWSYKEFNVIAFRKL